MSTSSRARPGEVWLAYVRFADHPDVGKVRPIVIIDERAAAIIVAKVTSAPPSAQFLYCELVDWREEGLVRPSRVQIAPLFQLSNKDLLRDAPIGLLSVRDRIALDTALASQR